MEGPRTATVGVRRGFVGSFLAETASVRSAPKVGYRLVAAYGAAMRRRLLLLALVGGLLGYRRRKLDAADRRHPAPPRLG